MGKSHARKCTNGTVLIGRVSEGLVGEIEILDGWALLKFIRTAANTNVTFQKSFKRNETAQQTVTGPSDSKQPYQ